MARPLYTEALRALGCPDWTDLRASVYPLPSIRAEDRIDATHALYCATCRPVVDRIRKEFTAAVEEALARREQEAPPPAEPRPVADVPVVGGVL